MKSRVALMFRNLLLFALFSGAVNAADAPVGAHGGKILKSGDSEIEVKIGPRRNSAEVYVLKPDRVHPEAIEFVFYDKNGVQRSFQLRATEHPQVPAYYKGSVDPRMESFTGLEIRIPFTSKKPERFQY